MNAAPVAFLVAAAVAAGPRMAACQQAAASDTATAMHISGFVEASYAYSTHARGDTIVGHFFDRFQDQFMLDAAKVSIDKPWDPKRLDAGFHVDALAGQDATRLQSAGLSLGPQGDLPQAYIVLNVPTPNGTGVQILAGKMIALPGVESAYDVDNPVWSLGYQATLGLMATGTGVDVAHRFSPMFAARLRVLNGWDAVQDINERRSIGGQVAISPDSATDVDITAWSGPEEQHNSQADRVGVDAVLDHRFAGRLASWLELDYGREDANAALPDSTRAGTWWGAGAWMTYALTPAVGLALRGDLFDDADGARTNAVLGFPPNTGQRVGSITEALNVKTWDHTLLREEVREDWSTLPSYDGKKDQTTIAMSLAYRF